MNRAMNTVSEITTETVTALATVSATVKNWLIAQKDKGKTAWTIIVVLLGLFGYQISLTKVPPTLPTLDYKTVAHIEDTLQTVDIIKASIEEIKHTQLKTDAERANMEYNKKYQELLKHIE